tara:strand:+ start:1345 stop:2088 length:744 start_codon:yes stop_codon:yes gene_type:complete
MISSSNDPGGLANQMFQYAAGYAHALKMGTSFYYPIKPQSPCNRSPNLYDIFPLSSSKTGEHGPVYSDRVLGFHYNPIPETPDLTLHGYYQSEKYFKEYEDGLREEFTFNNHTSRKVAKKTVSIHVRRDDYLNHPNYHPVCTMDYYHAAMREFRGYKFLVFSDDREWCLKWFDLPNVTVSLAATPEGDLELMSKCDHHIMANSSFSWWGTWLNTNKNKKVIAPREWFGPGYNMWDTSDLYDPSWKLL